MTKTEALNKYEDFISGLTKRMEVIESARKGGAEVKTPNLVKEIRQFIAELFDDAESVNVVKTEGN